MKPVFYNLLETALMKRIARDLEKSSLIEDIQHVELNKIINTNTGWILTASNVEDATIIIFDEEKELILDGVETPRRKFLDSHVKDLIEFYKTYTKDE